MPNVETLCGVIVAIAALVTAFIQYRKAKLSVFRSMGPVVFKSMGPREPSPDVTCWGGPRPGAPAVGRL